MSEHSHMQPCATCAKLPELLEQAASLQAHDSRLEGLLRDIEMLVQSSPASCGDATHECESHLPLMQALIPRLQKIYETLLVERHQLNKSITELDLVRSWSQQWNTSTSESSRTIIV